MLLAMSERKSGAVLGLRKCLAWRSISFFRAIYSTQPKSSSTVPAGLVSGHKFSDPGYSFPETPAGTRSLPYFDGSLSATPQSQNRTTEEMDPVSSRAVPAALLVVAGRISVTPWPRIQIREESNALTTRALMRSGHVATRALSILSQSRNAMNKDIISTAAATSQDFMFNSFSTAALSQKAIQEHNVSKAWSSSAAGQWAVRSPGVLSRGLTTAPLSQDDIREAVDEINENFAEARDDIEYALEAKESVYFNEEAQTARNSVSKVLGMYQSLLNRLDKDGKGAIQRSMGLKMEQLKGELEQLKHD